MPQDSMPDFDDPDFDLDAWYNRPPDDIRQAKEAAAYQAWRNLSPVGMDDDERAAWEAQNGDDGSAPQTQDDDGSGLGAQDANAAGEDAAAMPNYVWGPSTTNPRLPTVGPGAKYVLDQLAGFEGTEGELAREAGFKSGYDVAYGYRQTPKPLSQMTLDEVDAFQRRYPQHSGMGRYQIQRETLNDLKSHLGLNGTDVFSPELQDRLGRALLRRRGYDETSLAAPVLHQRFGREWQSILTRGVSPEELAGIIARGRTLDGQP